MTIIEAVTIAVEHPCEALTIGDISAYRCIASSPAIGEAGQSVRAMPVRCARCRRTPWQISRRPGKVRRFRKSRRRATRDRKTAATEQIFLLSLD
jgi:hypothetical protein